MKKEVKIVQLDKDTAVAFGFVNDISFGPAMLDAAGKLYDEDEVKLALCKMALED